MKLQLRPKSKREQALDAFASVAKTWSEWHLGKKVTTTAAKGAKQAAKAKGAAKGTPLKIAGAVAVVGGIGAAVAKKLRGGHAEPIYTPPGPAPDMAAPPASPVVVEDLTSEVPVRPATETGTGTPPETEAPTFVPETPIVVGDLAGEAPAEAAAEPEAEAVVEAEMAVEEADAAAPEASPEAEVEAAAEPEAASESAAADDDEPATAEPDADLSDEDEIRRR
jgi:hypothetical protein